MKELSIITDNRIGTLANVAEALGGVGINIEAIAAYEQGGRAVFRILTRDAISARKALEKAPGVKGIIVSDVVVTKMSNRPGELGKLTRKMANRGIDLESVYIVSKKDDYTEVAVKPVEEHLPKVESLLNIKH
ncbi:ACT domain-containing protein [Candidatus Micrarchaeota archaeon]|nr:ACT domain-containing protein [Candidatus Micrarchaeota archaeon]